MTHESNRLDGQRPRSHEFPDHEPAENSLDFRNTAMTSVGGVGGY